MKPSKNWFPSALGARADWFNNFAVQFALVAAALGFEPSEVTSVEADNQMMQFLVNANDQMNAVIDAARAYRTSITEAEIGSPDPVWPTQFAGSPPLPQVEPGLFERLDNLVKRIRVAPAYTPEIGELLGIIPQKPANILPEDLQPDPSLKALPDNVVEVSFVRGKTNGIEIQYKLDKDENWTNAGRFVSSPALLNIPQNPDNTARSVQVRARYVIGNGAVGLYSDIDVISTIP